MGVGVISRVFMKKHYGGSEVGFQKKSLEVPVIVYRSYVNSCLYFSKVQANLVNRF